MLKSTVERSPEWLLFFYTIPASPVNSRVKVWRKLIKAGAVQLKGGVYILPYNDEHREALQWLLAELPAMQGEGLLVGTADIEPLQHHEIIELFNEQRREQYREIAERIETFTGRIQNVRKGGKEKKSTSLFKQYEKIQAEFQSVQRLDFFRSRRGQELAEDIAAIRRQLDELSAAVQGRTKQINAVLPGKNRAENFAGLIWVTRKRPYVDRMACAWLVRRFIDPQAAFSFKEEGELAGINREKEVSFDVRNGVFTHIDDQCTFEVLLQSFAIQDKAVQRMAQNVHDIDMKDDKFQTLESRGIEMILKGIRNRALSDGETLEQGIAVFEALFASLVEKS